MPAKGEFKEENRSRPDLVIRASSRVIANVEKAQQMACLGYLSSARHLLGEALDDVSKIEPLVTAILGDLDFYEERAGIA